MNAGDVLFWAAAGLVVFAFALAVQMRLLIATVLKRAAKARFSLDAPSAYAAVLAAAGRAPDAPDPAGALRAEYAKPLSHLRLARKTCFIAPALLVLLLAGRRLLTGSVL